MKTTLTLRETLALWTGKLAGFALRLCGREGGSLPGLLSMRLAPELLKKLSSGVSTLAVCGTNGKTTCAGLISSCYLAKEIPLIRNETGANLPSGILTAFIRDADFRGRVRAKHAVIECDEAAAEKVFPLMRPQSVLLTNLFRDQLDRYGELNTTLRELQRAIDSVPECRLILNGDDSLLCTLGSNRDNTLFFHCEVESASPQFGTDGLFCPLCGERLGYSRRSYAHLGSFFCGCGYHSPEPHVTLQAFREAENGSELTLRSQNAEVSFTLQLRGLYNGCNAAAAALSLLSQDFQTVDIIKSFSRFSAPFGRQEHFTLGPGMELILAKNPAGLTEVFSLLGERRDSFVLCLCLNDNAADGRDISWIWDADFESLSRCAPRLSGLYLGGRRAEELALRLKYAEADTPPGKIIHKPCTLIRELRGQTAPVMLICSYTAMRQLRPLLRKEAKWN